MDKKEFKDECDKAMEVPEKTAKLRDKGLPVGFVEEEVDEVPDDGEKSETECKRIIKRSTFRPLIRPLDLTQSELHGQSWDLIELAEEEEFDRVKAELEDLAYDVAEPNTSGKKRKRPTKESLRLCECAPTLTDEWKDNVSKPRMMFIGIAINHLITWKMLDWPALYIRDFWRGI
jgi:hypothetical protein